MTEDKLYNVKDAMTYLRIGSRSTIYRLVSDGALAGHQLGPHGTLRFRRSDLDAVLYPRVAGTSREPVTRAQLPGMKFG